MKNGISRTILIPPLLDDRLRSEALSLQISKNLLIIFYFSMGMQDLKLSAELLKQEQASQVLRNCCFSYDMDLTLRQITFDSRQKHDLIRTAYLKKGMQRSSVKSLGFSGKELKNYIALVTSLSKIKPLDFL